MNECMTIGNSYSLFRVKTRRRKSVASQHEIQFFSLNLKQVNPFVIDRFLELVNNAD